MRRFLVFFLIVVIVLTFAVPAFADEGDSDAPSLDNLSGSFLSPDDFDDERDYWVYLNSIGEMSDPELERRINAYNNNELAQSVNSSSEDRFFADDSGLLLSAPLSSAASSLLLGNSSEASTLSLSPVPNSGSAYSDPSMIGIEYAPDAEPGTLTSVLYGLLGKPVHAYHYSYRNGNTTNNYTVYSVQELDYDANWLASLAVLLLVLYCIFKAGGALLCKL